VHPLLLVPYNTIHSSRYDIVNYTELNVNVGKCIFTVIVVYIDIGNLTFNVLRIGLIVEGGREYGVGRVVCVELIVCIGYVLYGAWELCMWYMCIL
jgi:hypothetical protein